MKHEVTVALSGGKQITFETGKLAKQAHGSTVVRMGDNVVLATAVATADPREGIDFFPLTVDYREYTYAGGRIPGGFIKAGVAGTLESNPHLYSSIKGFLRRRCLLVIRCRDCILGRFDF